MVEKYQDQKRFQVHRSTPRRLMDGHAYAEKLRRQWASGKTLGKLGNEQVSETILERWEAAKLVGRCYDDW